MTMCPICEKVYDESDYSSCPNCSDEIDDEHGEKYYKNCSNCGGIMYWYDGTWECSNCSNEIETDEDDNDGIVEY